VTIRIPRLEGALNFRDLGGYSAADGRSVRWKTLYRSGTTHAMTRNDVASLESSGIRYAYDFRSNNERRHYPTRLTDIAQLTYRFRDHDRLPGDIKRLLSSPDARADRSRQLMISTYRQLPYEFEDAFRSLFQYLSNGDLPLVFNCTAGKDRTGVAAALVLSALGVERETILEDYMLTEQFFEQSCDLMLGTGGAGLFSKVDRAVWEPLMQVHPDYLNAMFDQLQESHGSVERYLQEQLGVDREHIQRMRTHLLD
jgi:protein-tyrosine phosphatase